MDDHLDNDDPGAPGLTSSLVQTQTVHVLDERLQECWDKKNFIIDDQQSHCPHPYPRLLAPKSNMSSSPSHAMATLAHRTSLLLSRAPAALLCSRPADIVKEFQYAALPQGICAASVHNFVLLIG